MDDFPVVVSVWLGMAVIGVALSVKMVKPLHEDLRRAEEIIRTLPAEQIVDNPHILSQPRVPELVRSLMTKQEIRDISARPPIDEVVLLPEMRPGMDDHDP